MSVLIYVQKPRIYTFWLPSEQWRRVICISKHYQSAGNEVLVISRTFDPVPAWGIHTAQQAAKLESKVGRRYIWRFFISVVVSDSDFCSPVW